MKKIIDESTLVPIGLVGAVILFVVGVPWWASAMDVRVQNVEAKVAEVKQDASDKSVSDDKFKEEMRNQMGEVRESLVEIKTILKKKRNEQ